MTIKLPYPSESKTHPRVGHMCHQAVGLMSGFTRSFTYFVTSICRKRRFAQLV